LVNSNHSDIYPGPCGKVSLLHKRRCNVVHSYKPTDFACNSSLSVSSGDAINSGHCTASTCSGWVHFLPWGMVKRLFPKTSGMTSCQRWRISHGHNDNISETVLDRDVVTESDTHIQPIQQKQL